jgi:agmatinase
MPTGLKINSEPEKADIVLLCAPYDRTASFRKGTAKGPAAIIDSLKYQMETWDRYAEAMPAADRKVGLSELKDLNRCQPAEMVRRVKEACGKHLERGAFVLLLGGEHSVTTGALMALADRREAKKITVCQIDAHLDLRPDDCDYAEAPHGVYAHCTPMRRASELGFKCVHIGARAYAKEEMDYAREHGHKVFEWGTGPIPAVGDIVKAITTEQVYLSIDVDGIDPAHLPATGTPVPGGLEWYYTFDLLKELFSRKQIIGADLVEVAPRPYDVVTEYGAAQICYTMLALRETGGKSTARPAK